jgi:hypothetical protein
VTASPGSGRGRLATDGVGADDEHDSRLVTRPRIPRLAGVPLGERVEVVPDLLLAPFDDHPSTERYRYGFSGSAMASVIRGSPRTFLSFRLSRTVFTSTCSPSKSTHVGVTCGAPSGSNVATNANDRFSKRS